MVWVSAVAPGANLRVLQALLQRITSPARPPRRMDPKAKALPALRLTSPTPPLQTSQTQALRAIPMAATLVAHPATPVAARPTRIPLRTTKIAAVAAAVTAERVDRGGLDGIAPESSAATAAPRSRVPPVHSSLVVVAAPEP